MGNDGSIFDLSKYGADETGGDQFRPVSGKLGKRYPETRSLKSVRNIFDADHEPRETPAIILKWSNTGARATCGVCGGVEDRKTIGLDAFVEGTWETVCDGCLQDHAPYLAPFVGLYGPDTDDPEQPRYDVTGAPGVFADDPGPRDTEPLIARVEGLARRVRALEYLTPDAPNIGPYDELCPYCHRAMIGCFVGHKSRYAACDACKIVASTDAHGWHGFLDMANDAPGDPGAWMEQQYRDNHERIQSYQLIELGKFVDPSEYVEPYRDHARKRLITPPGRIAAADDLNLEGRSNGY